MQVRNVLMEANAWAGDGSLGFALIRYLTVVTGTPVGSSRRERARLVLCKRF